MQILWFNSASDGARPEAEALPGAVFVDSAESLIRRSSEGSYSAAVLDMTGERDAGECLNLLEEINDTLPVWVLEPHGTVASCLVWMKAGASHVATTIDDIVQRISEHRDPRSSGVPAGFGLIGLSRSMAKISREIQMIADRRCNLLIEGETGTGKEVVARQTHLAGVRSRGPWVAVNCSAIPEPLLEAELFGHARGAFTGAVQARAGKFEIANHGTIFLDEIGDMPLATQSKLLRVLQEREVERLGGNEKIRLDVRVIAATNVNLEARVREGLFRQDLFYRLNVFRIELPPLRKRREDIPALARHFVDKVCSSEKLRPKHLDSATLDCLTGYSWPGNVRELENSIEAGVIVSGDRPTLFPSDLRMSRYTPPQDATASAALPFDGLDYHRTLEEFEKSLLTQALARSRGNKTAAADLLRMKRTTLTARMRVLEARLPRLVA